MSSKTASRSRTRRFRAGPWRPRSGTPACSCSARSRDVPVAAMVGRAHLYEGVPADRVAFGVRVLGRLGIRSLVVTNAAGGINPDFAPGQLVLISDHVNLQGASALVGPNDESLGPRFPDMSDAYDPALRASAREAAARLGIDAPGGRLRGVARPAVRDTGRDPVHACRRRRPRGDVHGAGGDRGADTWASASSASRSSRTSRRASRPRRSITRPCSRSERARPVSLTALVRELVPTLSA